MNKLGIPLKSQKMVNQLPSVHAFFSEGFRPFFLLVALQAALMLPLWLAAWNGWLELTLPWPALVWHGHEMIFGFAGAAIGGFLLTAVPNWTNTKPVHGQPLMLLCVLWLGGRVVLTLAGLLPLAVVVIVELTYLPLLALLIARPILKARAGHNLIFLPMLAVLWLCDLIMLVGDAIMGLHIAIGVLLVITVVVAGRILPSFTRNWLALNGKSTDLRFYVGIEWGGAVGVVILAWGRWIVAPGSNFTGGLLLVAALLHLIRLAGWRGLDTRTEPLLWILHLGYLWLVIGLALLGLSSFGILPVSIALHALAVGGLATMIIGVMSRAALGHSGRPLILASPTLAAYLLLSLSALLRVIAPLTSIAVAIIIASGWAWSLAWMLFVMVYWPIVINPALTHLPGSEPRV